MRVLRSYGFIAVDPQSVPVAFIGGDVYDRWVRCGRQGPRGSLACQQDPRRAMGLCYLVDPARWGRGIGRAAIHAVLERTQVADVAVFFCGIDADNHASRQCAAAAGFRSVDPEPDIEGVLYYRREHAPDQRERRDRDAP